MKFIQVIATLLLISIVSMNLACKIEAEPVEFTQILYWTATGDDGNVGTASEYDLRFNTEPITDANWAASTRITEGVPVPSIAGTSESATFTFLAESETTIYFAIKVADEVPNWSALSNVFSIVTSDIVHPGAIVDLRDTP